MDINDLKNELGSLKAPDLSGLNDPANKNQKMQFIDRVKISDQKSKAKLKRFYILYFIIAAAYFGLFILNPDPNLSISDRINGTILFIGILLFAVFGKIKYSELKKINYDQPTQHFLHSSLERYKFWPRYMNYLLMILILINVGSCRSFINNYPVFEQKLLDIILFQIAFILLISIGLLFGYQYWKSHKKPFADEITKLLNE